METFITKLDFGCLQQLVAGFPASLGLWGFV